MSYACHTTNLSRAIATGGELSEREAHDLFSAMLDGGVPDLELGAVLMALHVKSESLNELLGFSRALDRRVCRLRAPAGATRTAILPCYGGAARRSHLLPLLALLLRRFDVPVLIHGELNSSARVPAAYVLRELGVLPCATPLQAQQALDARGIAYVPTAVLTPGLAALLSFQGRLGVQSSPHVMAKLIDPLGEEGVRVIGASQPASAEAVSALLLATNARALLAHATAGNPARRRRLEYFDAGASQVLFDTEIRGPATPFALPAAGDAAATAAWIRAALDGQAPVPLPIVNQLACCLFAAGYAGDLNQAKAIVAVRTSGPAAA